MLIFSSMATIVLAFLLIFFNRKTNANSIYLFLMFLFVSVHSVLQFSIMNKGPVEVVMIFFNNFSPLYFLIGPMLYFYVRGTLTDNARLSKKDIWHFVPAIIILANVVPYWFTPISYKYTVALKMMGNINTVKSFDGNWLVPSSINFTVRGLQMLSYVIASIFMLIQYNPKRSNKTLTPKDQERITFSWLKILVTCMMLAIIGYYASSLVLVLVETPEIGIVHNLFIIFNYVCFVPLLIIPLALLTFPQILYGIPALNRSYDIKASELKMDRMQPDPSAVVSLEMSDDTDHDMPEAELEEGLKDSAKAVMDYLLEEKPYLDKDFSMDKLAQALQLPRHHVYFCMNRVLKVKFPELRKQLRIQHAKQLLEQGKNKSLSIEGIGIQSGFSSRSNFFTAFKSEVGCTPSEYLDKITSETAN